MGGLACRLDQLETKVEQCGEQCKGAYRWGRAGAGHLQHRAFLIPASHKQRHSKRSTLVATDSC